MKIRILTSLFLFFTMLLTAGCQSFPSEKKDTNILGYRLSQEEIRQVLSQPITVTDPEILKELQFMRDQNMVTDQFYEVLLRTLNNDTKDYPGCVDYFCDGMMARESVQNMMKDYLLSGAILQ